MKDEIYISKGTGGTFLNINNPLGNKAIKVDDDVGDVIVDLQSQLEENNETLRIAHSLWIKKEKRLQSQLEKIEKDPTLEFDTTKLTKADQIYFRMLLTQGVKIKVLTQNKEDERGK